MDFPINAGSDYGYQSRPIKLLAHLVRRLAKYEGNKLKRYPPLLDYHDHHISLAQPPLPDPLSRLTIFNLANNDPISAQTVCLFCCY